MIEQKTTKLTLPRYLLRCHYESSLTDTHHVHVLLDLRVPQNQFPSQHILHVHVRDPLPQRHGRDDQHVQDDRHDATGRRTVVSHSRYGGLYVCGGTSVLRMRIG